MRAKVVVDTLTLTTPRLAPVDVAIVAEGEYCVVYVPVELDIATRDSVVAACVAGDHYSMVADLSKVTFMDCGGYGALVAARSVLELQHRTFTVRHAAGQPARLLDLIVTLEHVLS